MMQAGGQPDRVEGAIRYHNGNEATTSIPIFILILFLRNDTTHCSPMISGSSFENTRTANLFLFVLSTAICP